MSKPQSHRRPSSTMMYHLRASKPESERDSGFSDASSGYQNVMDQTDSEDMVRSPGPQVAVAGGSFPGLSPMIIMNNIVLNLPSPMSPVVKPWGFPSSLEILPQSQVILLHPMVPNGSNNISNNISPKRSSDKHRDSKNNYLPILKSYPKIAPHPGESSSRRQGASSAERGSSTPGYHGRRNRWYRHHGDKLYSSHSPQPRPLTPLQTVATIEVVDKQTQLASSQKLPIPQFLGMPHSLGTEATAVVSNKCAPVSEASSCQGDNDRCQDGLSTDNNKGKRFSNTYNILSNSGLLGITLRIKELIRQNRRTQGHLKQLQEQTDLFVEALGSGDPLVWTRLQLTLQVDTDPARAEEGQCQAMDPQVILA
ncbi:CLOCK-interacting pacemaker a isoform X2 [Oncorhynchus mykiss]|uniref:CLOCK-interacting pacemaker a n=1 Tax=Oncorhynchus mykiss TaxID=8022 RepID=A0A8C7VR10_ONCMY|nr:CLOCK-interacting pacemaker a isoform X2 [Oncorhynchus mykiss]XP_036818328.1 CLOCK-interacting pacemaker a isoform X2 [Oncorhynchus mykiss]